MTLLNKPTPDGILPWSILFFLFRVGVQKLVDQSQESATRLDEATAKGQKLEREAEDAIKGWTRAQSDLDELKRENTRLLDVYTSSYIHIYIYIYI